MDREGPSPCVRGACRHSSDDHHMRNGDDPTDPTTKFPCTICGCPDFIPAP